MADIISIDGNGISVKSYREMREAFMTKLKAVFGQSLQTDPSSPDGHLFDLIGYAYDEVKEALQGAIANLDVSSAEGVFLDNIARLMGLTRNLDEKDDELRARLLEADNKGLATFEGMLTYLRDNIHSSVTMAENPEPTENADHIPGHSFAVYIPEDVYAELEEKETQGEIASADGYIAQKIWECKPAGIRAYGNREGTAKDSSGMSHDIKFFVITASNPFYMKITVTEYTEEQLPDNYKAEIMKAVAGWALTEYTGGKDIIPQRAIGAIYKVEGIDTVNVQVSTDGSTWTTDRIAVASDKYAVLPQENIEVVGP